MDRGAWWAKSMGLQRIGDDLAIEHILILYSLNSLALKNSSSVLSNQRVFTHTLSMSKKNNSQQKGQITLHQTYLSH